MTKKELLKQYSAYINGIKSIQGAARNYRTFVSSIPFVYIDIVFDKWDVKRLGGDEYEETILNQSSSPCDSRTYNLWRFYKKNIKPVYLQKGYDYLQLIVDFINDGDIVYALSIVDILTGITELANRYFIEYNKSVVPSKKITFSSLTQKDYFSKSRPALRRLREWLELNKAFVQNTSSNSTLDAERKKIVKPLIYKIDGAMSLAREIGVDNFIKYAIDQCYFFDPEVVRDRMNEMISDYKKGFDLYARKSTINASSRTTYCQKMDGSANTNAKRKAKQDHERNVKNVKNLNLISNQKNPSKYALFSDNDPNNFINNYPIILDTDGNNELRSIINKMTGYTAGAGKGCIFQNYMISHIWGKAYDPRFFTNLWNVVLVPAWANDLLDKPSPDEGSLESRLKSTIMRICEVLYFNILSFGGIDINKPSIINDGNDIVRPQSKNTDVVKPKSIIKGLSTNNATTPYLINVIESKKNKTIGDVVKYEVFI